MADQRRRRTFAVRYGPGQGIQLPGRGTIASRARQKPFDEPTGAQNAEAVLGIVVGDALDEARQNLLG